MSRPAKFPKDEVLEVARPYFTPELLAFVAYCLDHAAEPLSVEAAATGVGTRRRALQSHLARAKTLPPRAIIAWCKALRSAWLLQQPGMTVERAALEMRYSSPDALRKAFQRCGLPVGRIRRKDGFRFALRRFLTACQFESFPEQ